MFENLQLLQHYIAIQILHELTGCSVPPSTCSETSFEEAEGTIISIGNSKAHFATIIICLRAGGSKNFGVHFHELYNYTFSSFPSVAFAQLLHQIGAYKKQWCPEKITVSSLSLGANENLSPDTFQRKATIDTFISSSSRRLISVSSQ